MYVLGSSDTCNRFAETFSARNNNNDNTCRGQVCEESSGRVLLALILLFIIYTS